MGAQLSRHAPRAYRFNFLVTLTVIAILATLLLGYLHKAQNEIEKVIVDAELNSLRLSLAEAYVNKSVKHLSSNNKNLNDSNPMLLIADKPSNYIGEIAKTPSNAKEVWYFDTTKKRLIYVFSDGHQARFKLSSTAGQTNASLLTINGLDLLRDVTEVD